MLRVQGPMHAHGTAFVLSEAWAANDAELPSVGSSDGWTRIRLGMPAVQAGLGAVGACMLVL